MFFHGFSFFAVIKYDNVCLTLRCSVNMEATDVEKGLCRCDTRVEHWCAKTPKINSLKMSRWGHSLKHLQGIYRVLVLWKMKRACCSRGKGFMW